MSTKPVRGLPSFWLILLVGWAPVILGIAIASSTVLGHRDALLNHGLFLLGYVLATVPLNLAHRALWHRRAPWTTMVPAMLASSFVVAFAVTTLLIGSAARAGSVSGGFHWRFVFGSFNSLWFVLLAFCAMLMVIGYYVSMQEERERAMAADALARDAELRALRYQLHPHFLFNTLNAISSLVVEERPRDATRMIARLGDFLRATLEGSGSHEVTLADELALTEHYLDIEKARLGDRLDIAMRIGPNALHAAVPWLLLQPLVENAIRHGIAPRREGGRLQIDVRHAGDRLHLALRNDGITGATPRASSDESESSALGLRNVRERLGRLYGHDHRFELDIADDGSCQVSIELPFRLLPATPSAPARSA